METYRQKRRRDPSVKRRRSRYPSLLRHALGGDVGSYAHFVNALGPHRPIFGIQATRSILNSDFSTPIQLLAQHYVRALNAFQPLGPIVLAGWSVGAIIAFETSHQLQSVGRQVPLLVVLDGILANVQGSIRMWNPRSYWSLAVNVPRWVVDDLVAERRNLVRRARVKLNGALRIGDKQSGKMSDQHKIDTFCDTSYGLRIRFHLPEDCMTRAIRTSQSHTTDVSGLRSEDATAISPSPSGRYVEPSVWRDRSG